MGCILCTCCHRRSTNFDQSIDITNTYGQGLQPSELSSRSSLYSSTSIYNYRQNRASMLELSTRSADSFYSALSEIMPSTTATYSESPVQSAVAVLTKCHGMVNSTSVTKGNRQINECDIPELVRLLADYSHKWYDIGTALGLRQCVLEGIKSQASLCPSAKSYPLSEVFNTWIQRTCYSDKDGSQQYATMQDLVHKLKTMTELKKVAEIAERHLLRSCDSATVTATSMEVAVYKNPSAAISWPYQPSSLLFEYVSYQRSHFSCSKASFDKWPWLFLSKYLELFLTTTSSSKPRDYHHCDKNCRVECAITASRNPKHVHLRDLLKPNIKKILVEGAFGVGKSRMSHEICREWGNHGELCQEYYLVVMLRFSDSWVQKAKQLPDLFQQYDDSEKKAQIAEEIKNNDQGNGVLLIFDGYNEGPLPSQESLFYKLFNGDELPNATVMVTTQPNYKLRRLCTGESSRTVEILGFGRKEIEEYIKLKFSGDTSLQHDFENKYLNNPYGRSLMRIPLMSSIVTHAYEQRKSTESCTITQLFTSIVTQLLLCYMKELPENKNVDITLKTFKDLPPTVFKSFCKVCKLAYDKLPKSHDSFHFSDLPKDFDTLCLMQPSVEIYSDTSTGATVSFSFLHLTIQEYLAAYYLSQLIERKRKQLELHFLEENLDNSRSVYAARFLAGLCQNKTVIQEAIALKHYHASTTDSKCKFHNSLSTFHVLLELQNPQALEHIVGSQTVIFNNKRVKFPSDYLVLGYCIGALGPKSKVMVKEGINDENIKVIVKGVGFTRLDSVTLRLNTLDLYNNQIGDEGVITLITILENSTIESLIFERNKIGDRGAKALAKLLKNNLKLKSLNLRDNYINNDGAIALTKALSTESDSLSSTLESLELNGNNISDKCVTRIKATATKTEIILAHNTVQTVTPL